MLLAYSVRMPNAATMPTLRLSAFRVDHEKSRLRDAGLLLRTALKIELTLETGTGGKP